MRVFPGNGNVPRSTEKEPLSITAAADKSPPRPCRFCGGNHWDRDCRFSRPTATAYHCYNVQMSQEEYNVAEEVYESMQEEVFTVADDDIAVAEEDEVSNEEEFYYLQSVNTESETKELHERPKSPTRAFSKAPPSIAQSDVNVTARVMFVKGNNVHACDKCHQKFPSRNLLFAHLRENDHFITKTSQIPTEHLDIVQSTAQQKGVGSGYAFGEGFFCGATSKGTTEELSMHIANLRTL
jgi:hypothetical protein